MARIRTIKPDFWTDEKIVALPFEARLLYIGLWNFADDHGYINDEPGRIKMQVFPADSVDTTLLLDLLVSAGFLNRYLSDTNNYFFQITHFSDHQRVDHPAPTKIYRESSRKIAIPPEVRRGVAIKYGCLPGKQKAVECYFCKQPGVIYWHNTTAGVPSSWVSFTLELDHFKPESKGGETTEENIILSCRKCNRSKGDKESIEFISRSFANPREELRGLAPEGNGMEGKGMEGINTIAPTPGNGSGSKPKGWATLISWDKEKGCFEGIAPEMFDKWGKAYPAVDLNSQLNRADEWLKANPTKQKSNYYRFIVNWLSRAQERGGR